MAERNKSREDCMRIAESLLLPWKVFSEKRHSFLVFQSTSLIKLKKNAFSHARL